MNSRGYPAINQGPNAGANQRKGKAVMKNYRKLTENSIQRNVRRGMSHEEAYRAVAIDMDRRGNPISRWGGADEFIRSKLREILQ